MYNRVRPMKKFVIKNLSKRTRIISLVVIGLVIIGITAYLSSQVFQNTEDVNEPYIENSYQPEANPTPPAPPEEVTEIPIPKTERETPSQWPIIYSQSEAISLTVVVNKKHKLPSEYIPELKNVSGAQLRPEAADALALLLQDASNAGLPMRVLSSYRSYSTQIATYNRWVEQSGQAEADTFSARPGHSEHQLGLAVDLGDANSTACDLETCFGNTPSGIWLEYNAHKYGYIIRYPEGKQTITGYQYEPWHLRYVGVNKASEIKNSGLTLDQFYGVEAGDY
jgi:zinc D-Ala-D-Ala carboxypeptidase